MWNLPSLLKEVITITIKILFLKCDCSHEVNCVDNLTLQFSLPLSNMYLQNFKFLKTF